VKAGSHTAEGLLEAMKRIQQPRLSRLASSTILKENRDAATADVLQADQLPLTYPAVTPLLDLETFNIEVIRPEILPLIFNKFFRFVAFFCVFVE
jgi:hypothetical protein